MFLKLTNAFDSHVHWLATGQMERALRLDHLSSATDVASLQILPQHFAGRWLLGFGWDQNKWPQQEFPSREILDRIFPDTPVCFSRADGHAFWVNTQALKESCLLKNIADPPGGRLLRNSDGLPSGFFIDLAMDLIKPHIPTPSPEHVRKALQQGMSYFNRAGFTHIRDLSCSEMQFHEEVILDHRGEMTLAVEQFFDADHPDHAESTLDLILKAKQEKLRCIRVKGLKVFYDGALGSEGALLSCSYCSGSGRGLQLMSRERLREIMIQTWEKNLELAVHVIGDEANHQVASTAYELWSQGYQGFLNLEHAQLMRPETIELLRGQSVRCHMQPCHWLSDRRWLADKIKPVLHFAFPWRALEEARIPLSFGSDAPIEEASFANTVRALKESAPQIRSLHSPVSEYYEHWDHDWIPGCSTYIENGKVQAVLFANRVI